ncbi:glycosyl hydrolase family 28 protein, partial [Ralstonia pseudosolanacearum]|uniref:glycosyl hydrolase family 28 protein n=1 Tax=Ralstonia pseudosolanacearum TaxID=1310165 RepID=UPI003D17662D
ATYTKIALLLSLALLSCIAEGHGHAGVIPSKATVFNILSFGGKPDGKTDNTQAFRDAWEAVCRFNNGKARLLIPKGTFLVGQVIFHGPCNNKDPIIVQLKGTVKATTDTSGWKEAEWFAFEDIRGLVLNGGGVFDGQGEAVWGNNACSSSAKCASRSVNLKFRNITSGKIGRITSLNPKGFHMCINNCHNYMASQMQLIAPGDSPNTDGIHISSSTNV